MNNGYYEEPDQAGAIERPLVGPDTHNPRGMPSTVKHRGYEMQSYGRRKKVQSILGKAGQPSFPAYNSSDALRGPGLSAALQRQGYGTTLPYDWSLDPDY